MPDFVDPNKHPSRRLRALKPAGYEPENYEEYYGADEQAELFDIMQGVRPEDRFSGEYGLLPYLGYYGSGNPDDPAYGVSSINKYDTKYPFFRSETKLSSTWEEPNKLMRSPKSGMLGFYNPENIPFEHTGFSRDIKYLEGSEYPSPGHSGVSAFYPQEDFLPLTPEEQSTRVYTSGSPFLSSEEVRTGKVDLGEGSPHEAYVDPGKVSATRSFPGVTVHELMHRGFYTEAVKDFSKEFSLDDPKVTAPFINPRTEAIDPYFQHILIDSRSPEFTKDAHQNSLETFQDQFLEWLTPEKQAEYDIDLPPQYRADGGPVYLAAGGTGSNIDNAAFTPNVTTYLPNYAPSLQGYFDDIGGISKAQAHAMNTAIEEGLATLEEQDPSKWTQEQIDAFNTGIEDRIIAAAAADPNDVQLAAAAAAIEAGSLPTPLTENEKWEAWEDFLDAYEPSSDKNADIRDAAEKATELFGYGTDDGKVAFLTAAARAGITTEQVAEATGTTVASILANLPNLNPFDYAKEAITGVIDWLKTAQGKCLVGIDGTLTCNFNQGGARTVGQTVSGVPVWKIPGTNTTVGVDLGNDLYNLVFGTLTCRIGPSGGNTCPTWDQLPQIIIDATLAKIQGVITDKIREEVTQGVMEALSLQEDGSFGIGVDMEKYCYNDDGSVRQVLVGDSCPTGTSETDPGCPIVDGVQQVRDAVTGECKAPDTSGEGVVCYSDTDGTTVAALEDGTCPLGSSTTAPEAETAQTLCTTSGGLWENGACVCPTKSELKTDGPNSGKCMADAINVNAQKKDCLATEGNTWDEAESKCYLADQTAVAAQNRCTESGGSWENGACVCTNVVGGADLVNGQCMVEAPNVNAQKEDCLATEGNTWDDVEKKCYLAAGTDNRTSQQICEDNGNTWDAVAEACITAGGLVNDDAKEGECDIKGDNFYWNRNNQTCVNRCPGGGLYNVTKDLCETTPSGNDPFASDHTTCAGITDYNQPAVNGVFPTVTQIFTAAEFEALGGTCPTHFGTTPTVTTPVCNIANAKLNELNECACEEGFAPVYTDGVLTACNASSSTPVCNIANAKLNELNECACEEGFAPVYTDGVLTACTKGGVTIPECPEGGYWDEAQQKCFCTGGYEPTYTDGKVTACTLIAGLDCSSIANAEINELNECGCKEGFTPVYTDGVLTACTKGTTIPGGCPANASKVNGVCKCKTDFTPVYADDGTTLIGCSPGGGDECPLNSTRNSAGNCDCDDDYTASVDGDGVMTCVPDFPAQNCTNPAWAATHVADCAKCADDEYAKDHPAICGIKEGTPYTRPYATFEGVDMVRPPWVTEATVNRPTEPRTYSILPAPSGNYEYGISSLARRPQDIRETVSVIDPGYEQIQAGGPPTFTMQDYLPDSEEAQRRQAARDKYYGAMNRLSDYSTQFNVGVDELSESLGVPQANFNAAPADGGFNIHGGNFNYATPTYGTPPEGYPTSPDLQAAENRPFYSPWLEEEEDSLFAEGGAVTEEPQGLESILQRRQNAVDNMFVKRGSGNGVR